MAAYNGQNITTWYTENFELEVNSTAKTTQGKYYIGGRILFLDTYAVGEPPLLGGLLGQPGPVTETKVTRFMHRDHLRSVVLITGIDGQAVERYSYDVWGKRRNLNGTDYTANGGHLLGATDEGYTGHEHLDHLGLVHMNGRIYDASLGRFMSADPFVAQPNNLQNYNRYAYVNNNPLSYTDPSGYFLKKLFRNKVFRLAATVAIAYYTGNVLNEWFVNAGWFAANSTGLAIATGAGSGFAAGFAGSGGNLKAGLHAGLTGAAFGWAGGVGGPGGSETFGRYLAHAAVGCASSTLDGGDCSQGAASALAGKYITNQTQHLKGVSGLIAATVAGGTGSVLSGGKFVNGAMTGAFGYLYNQMSSKVERDRRIYAAEDGTIETAGWQNPNNHKEGYGFTLKLRADGDGSLFVYAHIDPSSLTISQGDLVIQGQLLGFYASPANGRVTGPHLHFEWKSASGTWLDPRQYRSIVMPNYQQTDFIRFRGVHPVTGKPSRHNGYDLIGPIR